MNIRVPDQNDIDEVFYLCERAERSRSREGDLNEAIRQLTEAVQLLAKQLRPERPTEDE